MRQPLFALFCYFGVKNDILRSYETGDLLRRPTLLAELRGKATHSQD